MLSKRKIVANKRNGIDVDKWDYFRRDSHMLGIKHSFDHNPFLKFVRVIKVDNERQICTRKKEVNNLYDMFYTRYMLHIRAYQHKVCNTIEYMINEALIQANDHLLITLDNGASLKMSDCIDTCNMEAYSKLTDNIFERILVSTAPELKPSRDILNQIMRRDLYKFVGETRRATKVDEKDGILTTIKDILKCCKPGREAPNPEDLIIDVVKFDYGMKGKNPIDQVRFYVKSNPQKAVKMEQEEVSQMLPAHFNDQFVRLICKNKEPKVVDTIKNAFEEWCDTLKPI